MDGFSVGPDRIVISDRHDKLKRRVPVEREVFGICVEKNLDPFHFPVGYGFMRSVQYFYHYVYHLALRQ